MTARVCGDFSRLGMDVGQPAALRAARRDADLPNIHDDETARRRGFQAALVPGPIVATKALSVATDLFGARWYEGGYFDLRFVSPVYGHEDVCASADMVGDSATVRVETRAQRVCCAGSLGLGIEPPWDRSVDGQATAGVLPDVELGRRLGERVTTISTSDVDTMLCSGGDRNPWHRDVSPWEAPIVPPSHVPIKAWQLQFDFVTAIASAMLAQDRVGAWSRLALSMRRPMFYDRPYVFAQKVVDKGMTTSGRAAYLTIEFQATDDAGLVAVGRYQPMWIR